MPKRCFEDGKQEPGLDHYAGRTGQGLTGHLILTSVSYLFLAKVHQEQRGGNQELTVCQVQAAICPQLKYCSHEKRVPAFLINDMADDLKYHRAKRKTSRRSHRKRTIRRYHSLDISLNQTIQCHSPDG